MVSYERIQEAVYPTPPKHLIQLFNDLESKISAHPLCVNDMDPFSKLSKKGSFCLSATSIQSDYIAFVLGKYHKSHFPEDILQMIFNIPTTYQLQFQEISGKRINGCICVIHQRSNDMDLQKVYDYIYCV